MRKAGSVSGNWVLFFALCSLFFTVFIGCASIKKGTEYEYDDFSDETFQEKVIEPKVVQQEQQVPKQKVMESEVVQHEQQVPKQKVTESEVVQHEQQVSQQQMAEPGTVQQQKVFPEKLMIENFDAGVKPNLLGGLFGAWNKDPNDTTQGCIESFESTIKLGNRGYSLKLEYDVDSPNAAYNGFWMKLENTDFNAYTKLVFSIKGDRKIGFTDKIKLELKNAKGEVGKALVSGIYGDWQEITVPFADFRGIKDFTSMTEFVIVFDDITSNPKTGVFYVDDIYVAK